MRWWFWIIVLLVVIALDGIFAALVWATRYAYYVRRDGQLYRVDRFSGQVSFYQPALHGWQP